MNKKISLAKLTVLAATSFVSTLIPCIFWGLWTYCFNSQKNQADRVAMYNSYFPDFLNGRYTISLICILFSLIGIILSSIYWNKKTFLLKCFSIIVLVAAGIMLLLNMFSLM